ncbi:carbohydrate binding domain-containing protein [Acrocarpospora catenulata]|uniref:carbohydrate binding domain-containing protein n=1 Tax=Acrocarpospora catenulata TaxID=2836182 RepID=UPI0021BCDDEE|nr:carbohydrate-binding module family 20 domain-containing protein [Acrocarpospora catenulata]
MRDEFERNLESGTGSNTATIYYGTSWTTANIHYQPSGGSWTAVPGVAMDETACTGWKKKTINLAAATSLKAAFNNGAGTWDNNGGADYTIGTGVSRVSGGTVTAGNPCDSTGAVSATFNATATTSWGQNVFVVGNLAALGSWNPANAVPMSATAYPTWSAAVSLPGNTAVEYKYLKKNPDGSITWENGANRTFTTPSGPASITRTDTWR